MNAICQTQPRTNDESFNHTSMATFLSSIYPQYVNNRIVFDFRVNTCFLANRLSKTLSQNVTTDLFRDDYAALKRSRRDLLLVDKDENKIKVFFIVDQVTINSRVYNFVFLQEYQSFKYMQFATNMIVTSVDWHPTKKGSHYTCRIDHQYNIIHGLSIYPQ